MSTALLSLGDFCSKLRHSKNELNIYIKRAIIMNQILAEVNNNRQTNTQFTEELEERFQLYETQTGIPIERLKSIVIECRQNNTMISSLIDNTHVKKQRAVFIITEIDKILQVESELIVLIENASIEDVSEDERKELRKKAEEKFDAIKDMIALYCRDVMPLLDSFH